MSTDYNDEAIINSLVLEHSRSDGFLIHHDWEDPMNQSQKAKATQGKPKSRTTTKSTNNNKRNGERKQEFKAPVANTFRQTRTFKPRIESKNNGDIIVHYKEFVQDLKGSIEFASSPHPLNPGNPALFPWLSQIASRFDLYKFLKLKLIYEPSCATSAIGNVMFAIDFDPTDANFTSKTEFLSTRTHCRSAPWDKCSFNCLAEDLGRRKTFLIRQDDQTYEDQATTGSLFFGTTGQVGASVVGEIYLEYSVHLQSPQVGVLNSYGYQQTLQATGGLSSTALFGAPYTSSGSVIIVPTSVSSASVQALQNGVQMYVVIEMIGTGFIGPATQNGTAAVTFTKTVQNTAATNAIVSFKYTGSTGQTINISYPLTTLTNVYWRILPFNPYLV